MPESNTIQVIAEYIQKNEELLKEFREDIIGLGEDTEKTNRETDENTKKNEKQTFSFTELKSAIGLVREGYELVSGVATEVYGAFARTAEATRDLALASDTTATEASTLLQVLDDYQIEATNVTSAAKAMKEKGLVPTLETLAQLSDQFLAIEDPAERLEFAYDNLGKSADKFLNVLAKGGDELRRNATEVNKNLILSDEQVASYEKQRLALDALADTWEGMKVSAGSALGEIIVKTDEAARSQERLQDHFGLTFDEIGRASRADREFAETVDAVRGQLDRGAAMTEFYNLQLAATGDTALQVAADMEEVSRANQSMLGLMQGISSENQNYIAQQDQVKAKQAELRAEIDLLITQGWSPLSDKVKDLQKDYDDLGLKYDENAQAHNEAMNKILYDLYLAKLSVGGITEEEMIMAQQAGLAFGQLDQAAIDTARNFDAVAQAVADGRLRVQDMQKALDLLPTLKSIDVVINTLVALRQQGGSGQVAAQAQQQINPNARGYQHGGVSTGPESGHWELLHGTEAVIPLQNGSVPVAMSGQGAGGGNITVIVQVQSPITIMDQQQGREAMLQYVEYGVKALRDRGVLP